MIYHQSLVRKKRRALTFSVETSGPSPYIRGSEVKLDFMEWILFYFYQRLLVLDEVHPRQSKTRFQQFHPKKAKCSREKKGGKKTNFRSSCHRGRRCSTARITGTDGRVERKYRRGNESFSFLTLHKNTRVL